jgi:hypothetical protein
MSPTDLFHYCSMVCGYAVFSLACVGSLAIFIELTERMLQTIADWYIQRQKAWGAILDYVRHRREFKAWKKTMSDPTDTTHCAKNSQPCDSNTSNWRSMDDDEEDDDEEEDAK